MMIHGRPHIMEERWLPSTWQSCCARLFLCMCIVAIDESPDLYEHRRSMDAAGSRACAEQGNGKCFAE